MLTSDGPFLPFYHLFLSEPFSSASVKLEYYIFDVSKLQIMRNMRNNSHFSAQET